MRVGWLFYSLLIHIYPHLPFSRENLSQKRTPDPTPLPGSGVFPYLQKKVLSDDDLDVIRPDTLDVVVVRHSTIALSMSDP